MDGYSRAILSYHLAPRMTKIETQICIQKAREKHPNQSTRIISDNGPQDISKDFKEFITICEMTHVKTAPYYPQSNGKLERWHRSLKQEAVRPQSPIDLGDADRIIAKYIEDYNNVRLRSAIDYVPPMLKLEGKDQELIEQRRQKLKEARERRKYIHQSILLGESEGNPFSSIEVNATQSAAI